VQLAYQICAQGREDLAIAPDEATGFSMTLLRLLAFEPATATQAPAGAPPRDSERKAGPPPDRSVGPIRDVRPPAHKDAGRADASAALTAERASSPATAPATGPAHALPESPADWPPFVSALGLTGMAQQLAAQSELKSVRGNAVALAIPASHKHLADKAYADKLKAALDAATGRKLLLAFEIGEAGDGSLAAQERRQRAQAKAEGEAAFRNEPFVRDLVERFSATVRTDTIAPLAGAPSSSKQESP
jgi:DNA polymerase-3 subunit gamma/tau